MQEIKPLSNILYQRLKETLEKGIAVQVEAPYLMENFFGIPVYLDAEFVELVDLYVPEDVENDENKEDKCQRTVWLIELSEITAIAYSIELWPKELFEQLLNKNQIVSEAEE